MRDTREFRVCVFGAPPSASARAAFSALSPSAPVAWLGAAGAWPDAIAVEAPRGVDAVALAGVLARRFPRETLILLRSDAIVPLHAIERLTRALEGEGVLAAAALDNVDAARSPLADGARSDADPLRVDAIAYAYSERRLVDADLAGAIASAWHGERLADLGAASPADRDALAARLLRTVLLDHVYVAASGRALEGGGADRDPRDPTPPSPLAPLRARIAAALAHGAQPSTPGLDARPVVLHVLHGWGGGAERWVRDVASSLDGATHLVLIARGSFARRQHGEWLELRDGSLDAPPLLRVPLPRPIADTAIADAAYRAILARIVGDFAVDALVVSSLIGHSLDALRTGLPTFAIVHDHYPLWPSLHRDFGDPSLRFDDALRALDLAAMRADGEFAERDPAHWRTLRDATVAALRAAGATIVAPSRSALANHLRLAPELAALPNGVIAHGLAPWSAPVTAPPAPDRARPRVAIPGRVRRGKGAELLAAILPKLRERAEIILLGAGSDAHALFGERGVHIVLDYRRDALPEIASRVAPDAVLLLPTVAETFGYTLSEWRSLGVPVIATRVGALAERIEDGVDGFLIDTDPERAMSRIAAILDDRAALSVVRARLASREERTLAAMAADYATLLPLPARPPARYRLAELDPAALETAVAADALRRSALRERALEADLAATRAESDRRGDWGHDLDRRLDERTRWALALDRELGEIRPPYEQMLASTSWRITAPLRRWNARTQALRTRLGFRALHVRSTLARIRGSIARRGLAGTLARIAAEFRGGGAHHRRRVVHPPPREDFAPFSVPTSATPRVSIVIPVYDKIAYTTACLRSIAAHAGRTAFEIIVVDDGSRDATPKRLADIEGIRVIRNAENLGFIGSCNAGAAAAEGELLLFLNNDTEVTAGWLEALVDALDEAPHAGLVGAKLVYPDGRLQEAGGIVFDDGSGWNYGRFDDPDDPRYAFRREADYCSGAAILIRRALFERLHGFDTRYAPAYYEDTDLAFAVRREHLKVYYVPAATVIHFEGITSGTDVATGIKRFQTVNHGKFVEKWTSALAAQPKPDTPIAQAASHRARRRVLVVDATTPTPDQDSGSLRMVNLLRVLIDLDCRVSFLPDNRAYDERYTPPLQAIGVEMLYAPWAGDPVALLRERGREFDAIVLSRHYVATSYVGLVRLYAAQAKLVFDTVDLHYLRERREAELSQRADLARRAAATRAGELKLIRECDLTLVVSSAERALLAREAPGAPVDVLSNVHEVYGCRKPWRERRDLVFVGGFQHPPNEDAVLWFAREVLPRVRERLPDIRFHVIGSKVPAAIRALADAHVLVHGYVEDIAPFMDDCRLSVAPLRYGAGVKGKVNMAMSYGLPVVATPLAVEGMHVRDGEDVLVADAPDAFADAIGRAYADEALWNRLSTNGLANVERHFSFDAARAVVRRILEL